MNLIQKSYGHRVRSSASGMMYLVILITITSCGTWINPRYVKLSDSKQQEFKPTEFPKVQQFYDAYNSTNQKHSLFKCDVNELKSVLAASQKEVSIVVFYARWCMPCKESNVLLKELITEHNDKLNVIFITPTDWSTAIQDANYLEGYDGLPNASMVIDIMTYGTKFSLNERMNKFIQELTNADLSKEYGLPTNVIYKSGMLISTKTGVIRKEEVVGLLNL